MRPAPDGRGGRRPREGPGAAARKGSQVSSGVRMCAPCDGEIDSAEGPTARTFPIYTAQHKQRVHRLTASCVCPAPAGMTPSTV
ncbi:hypothetical protein GCM10027091_34650 [Streptomyces daliensis]